MDAQIGEWKAKCDEVQTELEASQKDSRNLSTELLKLRAAHEDASDKMDSLKKENRALTAEISSLSDNMGDGKQVLLISYFSQVTLSDKISSDKIFDGQNNSLEKIFDNKMKCRQFCPIFA